MMPMLINVVYDGVLKEQVNPKEQGHHDNIFFSDDAVVFLLICVLVIFEYVITKLL